MVLSLLLLKFVWTSPLTSEDDLHYLSVPVWKKAYMFGDTKSVVHSSTVPHTNQAP